MIDHRNAERIFEYIGGEEVNSDVTQSSSRYAIHFGSMSLEEAQRWPALVEHLRSTVLPERLKLRDNDINRRLKKFWWQYWAERPEMAARLKTIPKCIVTARVTKHLMMSFQPTTRIFSMQLFVFPFSTGRHLALLQSRVHEVWARLLSSSMRNDLRYTASECFETFPFPTGANFPQLDNLGDELEAERRGHMVANNIGLTTLYNRLKDESELDAATQSIRSKHEAVDRKILEAYGWSDIPVPPFCGPTAGEMEAFEDEVLDRLFALNEQRAKEELLLATPSKATKRKKVS
jgi:hypothetical protein